MVDGSLSLITALVHSFRECLSKVIVSSKTKLQILVHFPFQLSPKAEKSRTETEKTLHPHKRGNLLNITNHNIAAKWLEAPRKLQASAQDHRRSAGERAWQTVLQSAQKMQLSISTKNLLRLQLLFSLGGTKQ